MRARHDGFELRFTEPVDPQLAAAPDSYKLETYSYIYQSSYGSPEVDKASAIVRSAVLGSDGRGVRLVVDGLVEGSVHELDVSKLRSVRGAPLLHDAAYYTLNYRPAPPP